MPDIALCKNPDDCPKKDICHRALAEPSEFMQSYGMFYKGKDGCKMYWPVEETEE